jgi:hypothetical protein
MILKTRPFTIQEHFSSPTMKQVISLSNGFNLRHSEDIRLDSGKVAVTTSSGPKLNLSISPFSASSALERLGGHLVNYCPFYLLGGIVFYIIYTDFQHNNRVKKSGAVNI